VPSNLAGLLLFVVLLAPGFVHALRREAERPQRPISAFRETVRLVLVSVTCDVAVLVLLSLVRLLRPLQTPNVGALVRNPVPYARTHYALLATWSLGLLLAACLLAIALAHPAVTSRLGHATLRVAVLRWLVPSPTDIIQPISAWWRLFADHDHPGARIYLDCELNDGSYVGGWLYSYNPDEPETGDRDLVLGAPLRMRAVGTDATAPLEGVSAVVISARQLVSMHVTYVEPPPTL
jgi:Family of unknown function (DUF6338)